MRYAFYSHGGSFNHGCEAIAKTLSVMIKEKDKDAYIKLYTFNKAEDDAIGFENIDEIEEFRYDLTPTKISTYNKIKLRLLHNKSQKRADEFYYSLSCKNQSLKQNDVYISVGGDNYCYGDSHIAIAMNKELRRLGKKTVLWGCSVGEEDLTEEKIEDLKGFDLITARETFTYKALISHGIDKNTVLCPDSAFTLEVDNNMNTEFEVLPNTLGFNTSSLIKQYINSTDEKESDTVATSFLQHIIDETEMNILLIPHVTRKGKGDYEVLERIYNNLKSDRVRLVSDKYTASEYKSIISRCEVFIGARTHATIAAYSTCVPTLVMGYSIKSKGIASDIFGTDKGLVIPVNTLIEKDSLIKHYNNFMMHKDEYKSRLNEYMPEYIERARQSINYLFTI